MLSPVMMLALPAASEDSFPPRPSPENCHGYPVCCCSACANAWASTEDDGRANILLLPPQLLALVKTGGAELPGRVPPLLLLLLRDGDVMVGAAVAVVVGLGATESHKTLM